MILLSYDGSADARAALDHAARVLPGARAVVVTVWTPQREYEGAHGPGLGLAGLYAPEPEVDAAREQAARACAEEGAELARKAGLDAEPRIRPRHDSVAHAILAAAADCEADAIVLGSRGLGGVKSFLLGSVSHGVLQQADRPVMVVPSPTVARQRRDVIVAADASAEAT